MTAYLGEPCSAAPAGYRCQRCGAILRSMAHDFDELENQAVKFARKLIQRGECSDCVCRALAFAAMGMAFDTDNVASIRATLASLLRASERAEQTEDRA